MRFIVEIREKREMTQAEFSRELGISRQALEWLENRASERIGIPNLMAIWRASEMTANEFMKLLEREEKVIAKLKKDRK